MLQDDPSAALDRARWDETRVRMLAGSGRNDPMPLLIELIPQSSDQATAIKVQLSFD